MNGTTTFLLAVGCLFFVGLVADLVGRKTGVPRVTLLLMFGILAGPTGFDVFPAISERTFNLTCDITLSFVAFLLGATFNRQSIKQLGSRIVLLSGVITLCSAAVVMGVSLLLGLPLIVALVLAAIATATDPIATHDVARLHPNQGNFTKQLLGIVAIDDAWGIIAFSLILAAAQLLLGESALEPLLECLREIGGSLVLGIALGIPMAFLTGRIEHGEPNLIEALGFVLVCAGLSEYFELSMLLSAMTMGAITSNFARHHNRPFQAIEGIEWPLLIGFFFLIGATLKIDNFAAIALVVGVYIFARTLGRVLGGLAGAWIIRESRVYGRWYGSALLPQAGVALGMALVAHNNFPEIGETILAAVVLSTVIFELIGPLVTRHALTKTA
ncbi:MAG: cation:proton antiporter [Gammaproteobacteria bacterium]